MSATHTYLPYKAEVSVPSKRLPAGACDCHFHVFEDANQYPFAAARSYTPTPAPMGAYRAMTRTLGIERAVLVHPSVYGRDHSSFEHALAENTSWLRGVAVVYTDISDRQIQYWHQLGARGTRCNALFDGGAAMQDLPEIVARIKPLGWHLQVLIDVDKDPEMVIKMSRFGVPLVVDHYGHVPADRAINSKGFNNLQALIKEGNTWVKLSGGYRISPQRSKFTDVAPLMQALLKANPDRLVWGSDWPHPSIAAPMPDDGHLIDALLDACGPQEIQKILVDNPTRLYWND